MDERNPFRGIVDLMSEMERMRRLGRTGYDADYEDHERTHTDAWVPSADIFARGDDLVISLDLPALPREAIDITFSEGVLTVTGERPGDDQGDTISWKRERPYGVFRRSIGLPATVSESDISATCKDGLLTIVVQGACAAVVSTPRRIPVDDEPG